MIQYWESSLVKSFVNRKLPAKLQMAPGLFESEIID